jgi:hypothetical protein
MGILLDLPWRRAPLARAHPFHGRKVARGDHKIQLKFMIICI